MTKPEACIFCIEDPTVGTMPGGVEPERILEGYDYWWLVLQPQAVRDQTKQAAGMLVAKRHIEVPSLITPDEAAELFARIKPAAQRLCEEVGATYTGQESFGFNEGEEAGQSVPHVHGHILPVCESDPAAMKVKGGIMSAYAAMRADRVK